MNGTTSVNDNFSKRNNFKHRRTCTFAEDSCIVDLGKLFNCISLNIHMLRAKTDKLICIVSFVVSPQFGQVRRIFLYFSAWTAGASSMIARHLALYLSLHDVLECKPSRVYIYIATYPKTVNTYWYEHLKQYSENEPYTTTRRQTHMRKQGHSHNCISNCMRHDVRRWVPQSTCEQYDVWRRKILPVNSKLRFAPVCRCCQSSKENALRQLHYLRVRKHCTHA